MMERFTELRPQLGELSKLLNEFKSEAVQLRLLEYLLGQTDPGEDSEPAASTKGAKKKRSKATKIEQAKPDGGRKAKATSSNGPSATLSRLVEDGFFDLARTLNDIILHCKNDLALIFKPGDLSGKLAKMTRDQVLKREKNDQKQFAYQKR